MGQPHTYLARIEWINGNPDKPFHYRDYCRNHTIMWPSKISIEASADPHYRGDQSAPNPEDLFVGSVSSCHMLTFLAECARVGISPVSYVDDAVATMELAEGVMKITKVELNPKVKFETNVDQALFFELHEKSHHSCFIANSVSCQIVVSPTLVG